MKGDVLAQFIEDYDAGVITVGDLQRRLNFDAWDKDRAKKIPLPSDYIKTPLDPADIVVEKERMSNIRKVLKKLKEEVLTDKEWHIMVLTAQGKTQSEIAETLGFSQSAVSRWITSMREKVQDYKEFKELLQKPSPVYYADSPDIKVRYPMDAAMHKTVDGKVKCTMPEYLKEVFSGCNVLCCYCDREKCKRKNDNKDREGEL